jgi:hypothetical protein
MANFQAHFTAATITSTLAASTTLSLQLVNQTEVVALWFIGLIGGLLPDIDSDDSTSLRLVFKLFGIGVALFIAMGFYAHLSIVGLWLVGGLAYCIVRYGLMPLFEIVTVHRGSMHSLLCCLMFALAMVNVCFYTATTSIFAWCAGAFVMAGMLTHLTLDEMYAVDLSGMEFKRSFGSALKPLSLDYPLATGAQVVICAGLIYFMPPLEPILEAIDNVRFSFLPLKEWGVIKGWF